MNVLIAGNFLYPANDVASSRRIWHFANGLVSNKCSVHIFPVEPYVTEIGKEPSACGVGNISYSRLESLDYSKVYPRQFIANNRISNPTFSTKFVWFLKAVFGSFHWYDELNQLLESKSFDYCILYGRRFSSLAPIVRTCHNHNVKIVWDVVEDNSRFSGLGWKLNPIYWDWVLSQLILRRFINRYTAISRELKTQLAKAGKQVILIPALEDFSDIKDIDNARAEELHVVYLGSLSDKDAPDFLKELLKELSKRNVKFNLELIGKFLEHKEGRVNLSKLKTEVLISDTLKITGALSFEDLNRAINKANLLLHTRKDDRVERYSFPTRLVELLKTGRPVAVSSVGDIPYYLQDLEDIILLDPKNPTEGAIKIIKLTEDWNKFTRIGLNGRNSARKLFSRETQMRKLVVFLTAK